MAQSFTATIENRVAAYRKRMETTFRASAQDIAEEITTPVAKGGNMRIKTGFLRASLMASTSMMPSIRPGNVPAPDAADNSFELDDGQINLVIAGANIGDVIFLGFTAAYARPREYRDGFVRLAAQNWQQIVNRNAAKAIQAHP